MRLRINKSPNFSKKTRSLNDISFIIIHYTGMQSARVSIKRLKDPRSKVSCHYFIERSGTIYSMVGDNKVAWHAGKSKWKRISNLNQRSIGIEIQNKGHFINYQNFSKKQILSLIKLVKILMKKYKIKKNNILGHSDIAPLRKLDPGEKFPWNFLSKKGVAIWYPKINKKKINVEFKKKEKYFLIIFIKLDTDFLVYLKVQKMTEKLLWLFKEDFYQKRLMVK